MSSGGMCVSVSSAAIGVALYTPATAQRQLFCILASFLTGLTWLQRLGVSSLEGQLCHTTVLYAMEDLITAL